MGSHLWFGLLDMIACSAWSFVAGCACAYAYMRRQFLDHPEVSFRVNKLRNDVLEQAASYIECLRGPRDSDFYAAAVRELKGVDE